MSSRQCAEKKNLLSCERLQICSRHWKRLEFPSWKGTIFQDLTAVPKRNQTLQSLGTKWDSEENGGLQHVAPSHFNSCALTHPPRGHTTRSRTFESRMEQSNLIHFRRGNVALSLKASSSPVVKRAWIMMSPTQETWQSFHHVRSRALY